MSEKFFPLALVTGAAHRLGRAFAISLARQGYAIALHFYQSGDKAQETAAEIKTYNVPVFVFQADLKKETEISALFNNLDKLNLPLKVLVNSAAVIQRGDARTLSVEDFDDVIDLNLRAPFLCAQQATRRMSSGGLIINITDSGAQKTWTGLPAYVASKAGLESLTRVLARTFAPQVRVNAIAPGLVLPDEQTSAEDWQRLTGRIPLRRPASVEEITSALEFLLKNEYITGQTITVDGGYSLIG
jgi:NAD(P)-dependent dehydrogenase (short-subunit alcohol dehydrogenase family)